MNIKNNVKVAYNTLNSYVASVAQKFMGMVAENKDEETIQTDYGCLKLKMTKVGESNWKIDGKMKLERFYLCYRGQFNGQFYNGSPMIQIQPTLVEDKLIGVYHSMTA